MSLRKRAAVIASQQKQKALELAVSQLLKEHNPKEVFTELTDRTFIERDIMEFLTGKGYAIVKVEGLNQQIQFEETMRELFPSANEREVNLFTPYLMQTA